MKFEIVIIYYFRFFYSYVFVVVDALTLLLEWFLNLRSSNMKPLDSIS
jgi:hypothetical protein